MHRRPLRRVRWSPSGASPAGAAPRSVLRRQSPATTPIEVGAGPIGERSLAFVGRGAYDREAIAFYGYLDTAIGVARADLFTAPDDPGEATARFTYAAEITIEDRSSRGDLTTIAGSGTLKVLFQDRGGGDWNRPASFADGQAIAEFAVAISDLLQRQSPDLGVVVGDATLTQTAADAFDLAGEAIRFGHVGVIQRFRSVGALVAGGGQPLLVTLTGSSIVTERNETAPVSSAPVAATPPASVVCPALEPWLGETRSRIATTRDTVDAVTAPTEGPTPGAPALSEVVTTIASAATVQRALEIPEGAEEAQRLAVAALSTWARGLRLLAAAVDSGDESGRAAGQAIVGDGNGLAERAMAALDQLTADCS